MQLVIRAGNGACFSKVREFVTELGRASMRCCRCTVRLETRLLCVGRRTVDWCRKSRPAEPGKGTPDMPFSLFQGLAGEVLCLNDVLDPAHASFPGFEL